MTQRLKIGLAVGHGTGSELAEIFKRVVNAFVHPRSPKLLIEFRQASATYHTYASLMSVDGGQVARDAAILSDIAHYESFCRDAVAEDIRVIFRTAITAQSLYVVRLHLMAVKVEHFKQGSTELLLIRDMAQGFYSGSNVYSSNNEVITRTFQFSKETLGRVVSFSMQRARQLWGDATPKSISMVYKHHLFNGIFDVWAKEWSKESSVEVNFVQPDTMNRNLLASGFGEKQIIVAANEYADIMENLFLNAFNLGPQELSCAENVYLSSSLGGILSEYQTVHGSADDLAGTNTVNPCATIRAAASILEQYGGCKGIKEIVDQILTSMLERNITTADQGGNLSTSTFVELFLNEYETTSSTYATDLKVRGGQNIPNNVMAVSHRNTIGFGSMNGRAKL